MAGVIDLYRGAVVKGAAPDPVVFGGLVVEAVAVFLVCYAVFKRAERNFADVV
jgi:ABC-type polysaccharide/polyol phosphate export permease